jgi:hypothetical protein
MENEVINFIYNAVTNSIHFNHAEIRCGKEYEFRKRYEPHGNDLQGYHLSLAGDLKNKVQKLSNNLNREFGILPSALVGIALEVGINRAHALVEESGSIDAVLQKIADGRTPSNSRSKGH